MYFKLTELQANNEYVKEIRAKGTIVMTWYVTSHETRHLRTSTHFYDITLLCSAHLFKRHYPQAYKTRAYEDY